MNFPQEESPIKSDINVAPLVDVMLVLLVIFMITAPYYYNEIALSLPQTVKVAKINFKESPLMLSLRKGGQIFLGEIEISKDLLAQKVKSQLASRNEKKLYLRIDEELSYRQVAQVLALLKSEGIHQIHLVTEQE